MIAAVALALGLSSSSSRAVDRDRYGGYDTGFDGGFGWDTGGYDTGEGWTYDLVSNPDPNNCAAVGIGEGSGSTESVALENAINDGCGETCVANGAACRHYEIGSTSCFTYLFFFQSCSSLVEAYCCAS